MTRDHCQTSDGEVAHAVTRRDAIKVAGAALTGSALSASVLQAEKVRTRTRNPKHVLIAGAGIGGLCCGYELMMRGHDVTVLEASGRTGGHVFTVHDPLAGDLYGDGGAEHFTKPGYEIYREYVAEFKLPAVEYPRRKDLIRFMDGKMYTEEMLADREVLKGFGFNRKEVDFLTQNPWWDLPSLYFGPYLDAFDDEYQPFGAGLDELEEISTLDLLKRDGASGAAQSHIGSASQSALYMLWYAAILKIRGVPIYPTDIWRIEGGNQKLPDAFASRLGDRVRLGCPITHIRRGDNGVTVTYKEFGETKTLDGDYLVNCIPLPTFSRIPVDPEWPEEKQFVIDNVSYDSYCRVLLQSRTRFWESDGMSINLGLEGSSLWNTWQTAHEDW